MWCHLEGNNFGGGYSGKFTYIFGGGILGKSHTYLGGVFWEIHIHIWGGILET